MKVLLLGYGRGKTRIVEEIEAHGCEVYELSGRVLDLTKHDVVICFGYQHVISDELLRTLKRPVLNLHISYLPYNRGAHPNFWSWIEGTPAGVTIHEIDKGIDTGPICFQKKVVFNGTKITLFETYEKLIFEIEELFIENVKEILDGSYKSSPQIGFSTYRNSRELPEWGGDWGMTIDEAIKLYSRG